MNRLLASLTSVIILWPLTSIGQPEPVREPSQQTPPPAAEPAPADEPAPTADTFTPPPISDADSPVPRITPSAKINEWRVEGTLLDDKATVEGFLRPELEKRNWSDELSDDRLKPLLEELGYRASARAEPHPAGGVTVIVVLTPITVVRTVRAQIKAGILQRFFEPIFAEEIERRLTLRPGSQLARNKALMRKQLREQEQRIETFLRNDGFYDAKARIRAVPSGQYAAKLEVLVWPGAPYTVGKLKVVKLRSNAGGDDLIPDSEISRVFKHRRLCAPFLTFLPCLRDARFTRNQLASDIAKVESMYQARGFPGVRVNTDYSDIHSFKRNKRKVEFTIEVRERRRIDVVFEGNAHYPDEKLRDKLTLAEESSYDDVAVASSAEAIRRYYQGNGYFEATIATSRANLELFERVTFSIDEGPQMRVRQVSFVGNRHPAMTNERLQSLINTKRYRRVIIGESGGYTTSSQLAQDVRIIEGAYADLGLTDARVTLRLARNRQVGSNAAVLAAGVASGRKAEGLYVTFDIEEGVLLEVENVEIVHRDTTSFPDDQLLALLAFAKGSPYRPNLLRADNRAILRFYADHGYPRTTVESTTRPGTKKDSTIITHTIVEYSPTRVGKVAIRGNFKTEDWVVLDALNLKEGDLLTTRKRELAQATLNRTELFSAVRINYVGEESRNQEVVNVLVNVEERDDVLGYTEISGGYSTDSKAFVEVAEIVPNISGTGTKFMLKGQYGQELKSLESSLDMPHFFVRRLIRIPVNLELSGFLRSENSERFDQLNTIGATFAANRQFWEDWRLEMRYTFRIRNRDEELVRPAGASDDLNRSPVETITSALGPALSIDKRRDAGGGRNLLAIAKGWSIRLNASFAEDFLLGSNRFVKAGAAGQHYYSIGPLRITNAIRYDHGFPLGGDVLLPEVERFFAGGDRTVRGFEEDQLATEVIEEPLPPSGEVIRFRTLPAGGNIRFIHNFELQLLVWPDSLLRGLPVASALFLDTGLVTNSYEGLKLTDLRHSVGIAFVRVVSQVGSFSFEWAVPLDPARGDLTRGRIHINVGLLF